MNCNESRKGFQVALTNTEEREYLWKLRSVYRRNLELRGGR